MSHGAHLYYQPLNLKPLEKNTEPRSVNTNLSYFTLRKIIGWSGLLLPWAIWLVDWSYQPSISDYYYTTSGVLFTSVITLVGAFLISYRGYEQTDEKVSDNVLTWIGGILILIVAAVPTPYLGSVDDCPTPICHDSDLWGTVHFGSAAAFFIVMGYLSVFHFTRGSKPFTQGKRTRNRIYRFCGIGMWVVLGLTGLLKFVILKEDSPKHLIFWVEVIMLVLFGSSWLVKGKALVDLKIQSEDS